MKNIFTIALLVLCIHIKSQVPSDTIKWSRSGAGKLKITNFQAAPVKHSAFAAMSYISRPIVWFTRHDTLFVKLICTFIRSNSWFDKEKGDASQNEILLLHEQGHFDITEIEIRKTKKLIMGKAKVLTRKNFNAIIDKCFDELTDDVEERNERYDKETKYSTNTQKQKEWSVSLAAELQDLELYEDDFIAIPLRR